MRKNLFKSLVIFLLLPVLILVGCKNKNELPAIATKKYFKDKVTVSRNGFAENSTETLDILTQEKADKKYLAPYEKFELSAEPVWIYKMFIEKITFYVYCNETSETILTINLKMTDLATEEAIWNATQETVESETFESQCSVEPKAFKPIRCVFEINRAVIVATGSTITIDILNSLEIYSGDAETKSNFMWLIYDFEVHGESRAYTR